MRVDIPTLEGFECFACGTENPAGLHLRFYAEDGHVCSDVVLDRSRVGWQRMAHGGIVTTLLDEVMAWTVLYFKQSFTVTREITARFRRPVPVEEPLRVRARIVDDRRRYSCRLESAVLDAEGTVLAEARADFALLRPDQLGLLPERVRQDVGRFMEALAEVKAEAERQAPGAPEERAG